MSIRLILCNLKVLYAAYKFKYFLKFCSLQPKWCVPAGPKGTHSVCVCTIHQNVKLILGAIGLEKLYYEIIEIIVNNWNNCKYSFTVNPYKKKRVLTE